MKLWASASAIGISVAYLASMAACSSTPPADPVFNPSGGTSSGGSGNSAGSAVTAGTTSIAGGGTTALGGSGGTAVVAGAGGTTAAGAGGTTAGGGTTGGAGAGSCPTNVVGHCDAGAVYPTHAGYTLALVEDFPAPLDLDKDPVWTWSDGSPADGQTGFRKENITFANGKMIIKAESMCAAKTTNSSCYPPRMSYGEALSPATQANVGAMGVYSGELRTKYNNYRYGRYEVKYKAPIANPGQEGTDTMSGNYLSTMFIFRNPKNTTWNEIDIELEPWKHNHIAGNVVNAKGATGYPAGNASAWDAAGPGTYAITQEHVYAFTWTPTSIDWYIDDVATPIHSFAGTPADPIPTLSAKIMMNLWVFSGATFGDGVNNKFPFTAEYDYFHFYKLDSETTYPCANLACMSADDKSPSAQNNPSEMNYGK